MELKYLNPLMKRGSDFLQCKYPILCGAMTWVSEPNLVAAVCNSGCFGCLAGGNAPTEILRQQIEQVRSLTKNPFAVNLITIAPAYLDHLAMLKEVKVPYIIFAGSFPKEKEVLAAKETGAKVLCFASTVSIAERMIKFGADAIILEGSEAGGHIGEQTTMTLVPQVVDAVEIPVIAAGGIADGRGVAAAMMLGAEGVQMGTRFVAAAESIVHENYKERIIKAKDIDSEITGMSTGHPIRVLRNQMSREYLKMEKAGASFEELEHLTLGSLRKAVVEGDVVHGSLMAGQSAGLVKKQQACEEILAELMQEANALLGRK